MPVIFVTEIIPLLGHCIATWYAMSRYLVKLTEFEISWVRSETVNRKIVSDKTLYIV